MRCWPREPSLINTEGCVGKKIDLVSFLLTGWWNGYSTFPCTPRRRLAPFSASSDGNAESEGAGQCRRVHCCSGENFGRRHRRRRPETFSEEEARCCQLELPRPSMVQILKSSPIKRRKPTIKTAVTRAVKAVDAPGSVVAAVYPQSRRNLRARPIELPRPLVKIFEEEAKNCRPRDV